MLLGVAMAAPIACGASAKTVENDLTSTEAIETSDLTNFYALFDATDGNPTAEQLQIRYFDVGSPGLTDFIENRIYSSEQLAERIAERPEVYVAARDCVPIVEAIAPRFDESINRFREIYPDLEDPKITFVIGRDTSGGTVTDAGVLIGLEVVCRTETPDTAPLAERFYYLGSHEIVHTQQEFFDGDTLLARALTEGVAEFIGELISGRVLNGHLSQWVSGHELEFERRFRDAMYETDTSEWLYNGIGTADAPGDLGYWVGYRIAQSLYERMDDKREAIRVLLESTDAEAVLTASGWLERFEQ